MVIICKLEYFTSFSKHAEEHFQWIEKWPKKEKKKKPDWKISHYLSWRAVFYLELRFE